MILLLLPYAIQLVLIVHAIQTGRNTSWIWLLIMLPYVGGLIYIFMEVLPDLRRGRLVDVEAMVDLVDKSASVKRLKANVVLSDTLANRVALADEYYRLGQYQGALDAYRRELTGIYADDTVLQLKVAKSAFFLKDYATADEFFQKALAAKPTTSTELLRLSAYARWEVRRDSESLTALEDLYAVNKTGEVGLSLCHAYRALGLRDKLASVIEVWELQSSRLRGSARARARRQLQAMRTLVQTP